MQSLLRVATAVGVFAVLVVVGCSSAAVPPPAGSSGTLGEGTTNPTPPDTNGSSGTSGTSGGTSGSTPGGTTTPTPAGWGKAACPAPAAATGFAVGQSIGELGVKDCLTGADATIDDVCGASATWIFAAHTHCPTCQATAGFTDEVAAEVAPQNVAIVHIVHDDNGTSCEKWTAAYKLAGLGNVKVYADPTGDVWSKLKTSNYTAPSAFLDKNRVVTYREHSLSKTAVLAEINAALAK